MTFAFRTRGVGSGERVQRVAVLGEWGVGNQCRGQRCWERGEWGTSAAGSGARRMGSEKSWKGVANHAASCPRCCFHRLS
ncbi:hypothetical protein [Hoylesella buccalis]|uniref:hypothetical protein n=1 Tax=Hoylesella buccalis TaxID=28127 RepID=UPI0012DD0823|nr:hypothetical protein [Hoylesella buccalis]